MRTLIVPLQMSGRGGFAVTIDPGVILSQQIQDLLVTFRFERTFMPNHGCNLGEFLFAPIEDSVLALKATEIKDKLSSGISFGSIVSVEVAAVPNKDSTVRITVMYKITEMSTEVLSLTKTVSGLVDEETPL